MLHYDSRLFISLQYPDSSPSEMWPLRVVSSANMRSLTGCRSDVQVLVYRENKRGETTQPRCLTHAFPASPFTRSHMFSHKQLCLLIT